MHLGDSRFNRSTAAALLLCAALFASPGCSSTDREIDASLPSGNGVSSSATDPPAADAITSRAFADWDLTDRERADLSKTLRDVQSSLTLVEITPDDFRRIHPDIALPGDAQDVRIFSLVGEDGAAASGDADCIVFARSGGGLVISYY